MNTVIKILKRYKSFLISLFVLIILSFFSKSIFTETINSAGSSILQMLSVLPPIMIMLGLMDLWIPREQLMKYMGNKSGIIGVLFSMLIGSVAAGPMYAAFPFTAVLIKKGAKFSNIIIFMNSWCLIKISTLLFEFSALGYKFTLVRLLIDIPGVLIMSYLVNLLMSKDSLNELYNKYNRDATREEIAKAGVDKNLGQYFAALTNMRSVGVMGDERTYDYAVALRAVTTSDFMTAESADLPWEVLGKVTTRIVNEVKGVNRVMYDCTGKPPATIEFE